jgi:uncharacterized protein YecE (DUF72 family)
VHVLIGTSGWTYDHWRGVFYPPSLAKAHWLDYYAAHFPTVEVNATFYRSFAGSTYEKWRDRAPAGFCYVFKAPRLITHRKYLKDTDDDIRRFWAAASLAGDRLGMVLLQLAPSMPYELERLRRALVAFPDPTRVAVEFRSERWQTEEAFGILHKAGATYCTADSPESTLTDRLTSHTGYIRLHGRRRWYDDNYTAQELREIAHLIQRLGKHGARTVYVFFNNDPHGYAPANAQALMSM